MRNMKGENLADPFWTGLLLMVLVALALVGLLIYLKINFPFSSADPISYSIDFVHIANQPFMLAEVLAHVKFERSVLEQSIEIVATSPENAQALELPEYLTSFTNTYGFRDYRISVIRNNEELISAKSTLSKCGNNNPLEGWCVSNPFTGCDVGRVKLNNPSVDCGLLEKCCVEDRNGYSSLPDARTIVTCGPRGDGVCSRGSRTGWAYVYDKLGISYKFACGKARVDLGNPPECRAPNGGETPACCAPLTDEVETIPGFLNKVSIPLLYKNLVHGTLEVTAR